MVLDVYPWNRSAVSSLAWRLVSNEDNWTMEELLAKLKDPEIRKKLEKDALDHIREEHELTSELLKGGRRREAQKQERTEPKTHASPDTFGGEVVVYSLKHPEYVDKTIEEIANMQNAEPIRALTDLILEDKGWTRIAGTMVEEDVRAIMKYYATMISTDSFTLDVFPSPEKYTGLLPHPRDYGTYPRVLGHYSRDIGLFPLEEAVRKMTALPAQTLRLRDRGLLRKDFWADVVVFNPKTILEEATYAENRYPDGIEYVLVNGQITVKTGIRTEALAGKILRRPVS